MGLTLPLVRSGRRAKTGNDRLLSSLRRSASGNRVTASVPTSSTKEPTASVRLVPSLTCVLKPL